MEKVKLFNLLTFSNNVQSILNLWNEMKLTEPLYHTGLNPTESSWFIGLLTRINCICQLLRDCIFKC